MTTNLVENVSNTRPKANWCRLIQKVYEVGSLECTHCGTAMRIIALVDEAEIFERILKQLKVWDAPPEPRSTGDPNPPLSKGETLPLSYQPMLGIA